MHRLVAGTTIAVALWALLLGATPGQAWAVGLSKYAARTEDKKVVLVFTFGDSVDYDPVFHYDKNFVTLKVKELKFSRAQSGKTYLPDGKEQKACFSKVSLNAVDGAGEIKIQLTKGRTPADTLVVPEGKKIIVEITLPSELMKNNGKPSEPGFEPGHQPAASDAGDGSGNDPAANPGNTTWPPHPAEAEEGSEEAGSSEATEPEGSDPGASEEGPEPGGFRDGGPEPSADPEAMSGPEEAPAAEEDPGLEAPAESGGADPSDSSSVPENVESGVPAGRSYKLFDLSQVPASQQQFSNLALSEAVMRLVDGSGFNVVVGEGVSDMPVTLSFTDKQISLKRALELLCMAYSLEYWVEDDAIILRGKL